VLEHAARFSQSIEVHLFFASIVWLAAFLLTSMPRGSATTKYWIWVITSLNFLLPLSIVPVRLWPPRVAWFTPGGIVAAVTDRVPSARATIAILIMIWSLGSIAMFVRLALRMRAGRRDAQIAPKRGPAVDGLLRPRISLPDGIDRLLTRDEIDAVFIHELTHAKRRDNLIRLLYEVSLCILWFHPLVWSIGVRLALYRELSCDEAVAHRGLGKQLVSALAKLVTPEAPSLLQARASSFLSHRLARLNDDPRPHSFGAANILLALAFAAILLAAIIGPVAQAAAADACARIHFVRSIQ
jgi:beta-lactamase regulating signal transducer with metallopeptidase domain